MYIYIYCIYNITYIYRNFICLFTWKCQMEIYKKIINISSLSLYVYIYIYLYIQIYIWKTKYEVFLQWNIKFFFFRKFCFSYILDLAKTAWALRITRNIVIKEFWALENHVLVNMLLCSSHCTEVQEVYIGTQLKTFSLPFPCSAYLDAYLRLPSLADFLRWLWQHQVLWNNSIMTDLRLSLVFQCQKKPSR